MGTTKIEWAHASWNPITGCDSISEGCLHCYARRMALRLRGRAGYPVDRPFAPGTFHPDRLQDPARWRKARRIFVCSMGDLFHPAVEPEHIRQVYNVMQAQGQHIYMVLTKRPVAMGAYYTSAVRANRKPERWILHGITAENQPEYDKRIEWLWSMEYAHTYLSLEPLLGPITLNPYCRADWVIVGGETGPNARHMDPAWARSIRDQCKKQGIPFFFKRMSGKAPTPVDLQIRQIPAFARVAWEADNDRQ